MKLSVSVIPGAKENSVTETEGGLKVRLRARAIENKANDALVCVLADHFGVKKSQVRIKNGYASRNKLVEVDEVR